MTKDIALFFDRLEDKTRKMLSHYPILYALLAGIGIVLFWRGIWHTTDFLTEYALGLTDFHIFGLVDGPLSFLVGTLILLVTGVYVSAFIGNRLIISGLSGEKKLTEKTAEEILTEEDQIKRMQRTLNKLENQIVKIEEEIEHHHPSK